MNNVEQEHASLIDTYAELLVKEAKRMANQSTAWHNATEHPEQGERVIICTDTGLTYFETFQGVKWMSKVKYWLRLPTTP